MLIISGTAEFVGETGKFVKGDIHVFTMFCSNENLDDQLEEIESYFNNLNWDEIVIEETGLIPDSVMLENDTLKMAFNKANQNRLSVVMENKAISKAA